jgi:WD40 repeat protein
VLAERVSHFEATALAFSPDGEIVAVGTSIGQVKLFNSRTGELLRSLDDEQSKLADEKTPEEWKSLRRAMGSVASLAFSPDGSLLATCGGSFADFAERFAEFTRMGVRSTGPGRLKLWDVQTGTLKHDLVGHNNHANAVAFSPDGHLLASAGRWLKKGDFGNGVIIWNPHTGTQIHRLIRTTASGGTRAIAFSPDSKLLAIGTQRFDSENDTSTGGVSLVQVSSGNVDWLQTVPGWAKPLAFSPDGKSVVVLCGGRSIRFLETGTGTVKHEIRPADPLLDVRWKGLAIAKGGRMLAIGGVDDERKGSVEVWSTRSSDNANEPRSTSQPKTTKAFPKPLAHFTTGAGVRTIACSGDGELTVMANGAPVRRGGRVIDDWKPSAEILGIGSLELTTGDEDALLAATGRSHFEVTALALSPDGKVVAVGTSVGQVKLFSARTGDLVRSLDDQQEKLADKKTPEKFKALRRAMGSVTSLAFSPDGSLLATCGKSFDDSSPGPGGFERLREFTTGPGRLKVWEVKTGTLKHDLVGHSHAHAVSFSTDGNLLASAGRWGERAVTGVIIWNPHTGAKIRTIRTNANGGTHAVAFSPNRKLVVIGSRNFDKENDTSTTTVSLAYALSGITVWQRTIPGWANPKAFSPDGRSVAVLCGGQSIRFFEVETGVMMHEIRSADYAKGGRWHDFAIAPQGHILAIGGVDSERKGSVELWDFLWDFDGPGPPASSAPAKDAEHSDGKQGTKEDGGRGE